MNKFYDTCLGKKRDISIYPSQEKDSNNNCVIYEFNSYSSISYIINSLIIYYYTTQFFYISYIGSILSFLLGIASFLWWASQREFIQKIDIALYSTLILWPGMYGLSIIYNNYEFEISSIFIFIISFSNIFILTYGINCKVISILNVICFIFSVIIISTLITPYNINYILVGINSNVLGFLLKFSDTYKVLNPKYCGAGTGWFHILTALGIIIIWFGLQ